MTLTVSSTGDLVLPAELVPAKPYEHVEAIREGGVLVLKPVESRAAGDLPHLRHSICNLPVLPGIWADPQSTFRREDLYGEDGR